MAVPTNTADQQSNGGAIRSEGDFREMDEHLRSKRDIDRRRFLGLLGAGAAAIVGIPKAASAAETPVVTMRNNYFDPIGLYVEPGTTVQFEIEAGSHSATTYDDRIPTKAVPFDSGVISEETFEYSFDTPGTYDYYCIPHQSMGMVGRIVVREPGGPAEASPIPDGDVPDSEVIVEQGAVAIDDVADTGRDTGDGMMGSKSRSGMMDGHGPGWMMVMPLGFMTAVLGVIGGAVYGASQKATANREEQRQY